MDPRFYEAAGPLPLGELVAGLAVDLPGGRVRDDEILRVAPLAESRRGDIAFLGSRKQLGLLESAEATACFVPEALAAEVGKRGIVPVVSQAPKAHFGRVIPRLFSVRRDGEADIHPDAHVHPTAVIGPGVRIGAGTEVGAFAVIAFADVGEDCEIKSHAAIGGNGLGVEGDEAGRLALFHVGTVAIGDRVRIGSQTCVDRGLTGATVIEDDVKLDNLVQVAHNCRIGARTVCASFVGISGSCDVGSDVLMGGQVGLADHITVGDGAKLLAKAGVMNDIPAGESWIGSPAQPARQFMREVASLRKLAQKPRNG